MDDQRDTRAADSSPQNSTDESSSGAVAAGTAVARMLANPRRVRRS